MCCLILLNKRPLARVKVSVIRMYNMNWKSLIASVAVVVGLGACSSTPASRIKDNPVLYNSLPAKEQALVAAGRIAEGMSPPAVFLAWGDPSGVAEGNLDGRSATRWIYSTLQPVYATPPAAFWYGPYWNRGYWGPGFYGPYYPYYNDITYIPVDTGYVLFINGKVQSWERRR